MSYDYRDMRFWGEGVKGGRSFTYIAPIGRYRVGGNIALAFGVVPSYVENCFDEVWVAEADTGQSLM